MNVFVKWLKDHAVTLVCSLLIVLVLAGSFSFVMMTAARNTELDVFRAACRPIEEKALDIAVLSEYETGRRDPGDTAQRDIPRDGDIQEVRDKVFSVVESGYTLPDRAVYIFSRDGKNYEVDCAKDGAERFGEDSSMYYMIGGTICVRTLDD